MNAVNTAIAQYLSPQAKAVWSAALAVLFQVSIFVGSGGVAAVAAITLGQWIQIAINTSLAWGIVYNAPNTPFLPKATALPVVEVPAVPCSSTFCTIASPHTH